MSEIQPGDGWRLLTAGEELRHGDKLLTSRGWLVIPSIFIGERVNDGHRDLSTFRRRIPAKPEAFGVLFYQWRVINGKAVILIDMERAEFNAEQARQLANWLNRYAVWREAQESK